MAMTHQPPNNIAAHAAQTNHAQLHSITSLLRIRITGHGIAT
jgi:hypothetical protein